MSVVHAAPHAGGAEPWPTQVRRTLAEAGPQQPEVVA
jgi:2-aminobenzoate-CoA ligase